MIAVIFEVWPADGHKDQYLDHAARMKGLADETEGFLSVERFQSLSDPSKLLSLSFFADEVAVTRWRNTPSHRGTQTAGRAAIFDDYRLRVAAVDRDYGMTRRAEVPKDSLDHHDKDV